MGRAEGLEVTEATLIVAYVWKSEDARTLHLGERGRREQERRGRMRCGVEG